MIKLFAFVILASTLLAACGADRPPVILVPDAKSIGPAPSPQVPTATATTDPEATLTSVISSGIGRPVLEWQGLASSGANDPPGCKSLQILAVPGENTPGQMAIGPCGTQLKTMPITRPELTGMVNRLGPFELKSPQENLIFRGLGQIDSPAWHRAVLVWAQSTYNEVATSHVCAACRTVLSWYLGPVQGQEGMCRHLSVLDFGYAYAALVPCSGGAVKSSTGGWIETGAWEQFDEWLYGLGRVDKGNSYFDGKGSQLVSADELKQLEDWAGGVIIQVIGIREQGTDREGRFQASKSPRRVSSLITESLIPDYLNKEAGNE